ncbi:MAG: hypothetical protein OEY28_06230 [Nitrospira sp.]|nr:hypothetical protein [Nitrospira sp.]
MEVLINGVRYIPAPPEPTGKGLLDALEVRFDSDAGDGLTVRQYLHKLMSLLWKEQESFDGKRPFGNSDWEFDLYKPLAKAGFIDLGPLHEEDGEPFNWTKDQVAAAHAYVQELVAAAMFTPGHSEDECYQLDDVDRELIVKVREGVDIYTGSSGWHLPDEDGIVDALRLLLQIIDEGFAK